MPFITMNAQEFNPNADKVSVKINKHQLGGKDKVRRWAEGGGRSARLLSLIDSILKIEKVSTSFEIPPLLSNLFPSSNRMKS